MFQRVVLILPPNMSSTAGTHLGNTPLHLEKLRQVARKELPQILDSVEWWHIVDNAQIDTYAYSLALSGPREKEPST